MSRKRNPSFRDQTPDQLIEQCRESADYYVTNVTKAYAMLPELISALYCYTTTGNAPDPNPVSISWEPNGCILAVSLLKTIHAYDDVQQLCDAAMALVALRTGNRVAEADLAAFAGVSPELVNKTVAHLYPRKEKKLLNQKQAMKVLETLGVKSNYNIIDLQLD